MGVIPIKYKKEKKMEKKKKNDMMVLYIIHEQSFYTILKY